jgi:hypothetical protein
MGLRRYWIEFPKRVELPPGFRPGCGVTAFDLVDAFEILRGAFRKGAVPAPTQVVEDVDIRTLDQEHVVPNMGDVTRRGIWFPRGEG